MADKVKESQASVDNGGESSKLADESSIKKEDEVGGKTTEDAGDGDNKDEQKTERVRKQKIDLRIPHSMWTPEMIDMLANHRDMFKKFCNTGDRVLLGKHRALKKQLSGKLYELKQEIVASGRLEEVRALSAADTKDSILLSVAVKEKHVVEQEERHKKNLVVVESIGPKAILQILEKNSKTPAWLRDSSKYMEFKELCRNHDESLNDLHMAPEDILHMMRIKDTALGRRTQRRLERKLCERYSKGIYDSRSSSSRSRQHDDSRHSSRDRSRDRRSSRDNSPDERDRKRSRHRETTSRDRSRTPSSNKQAPAQPTTYLPPMNTKDEECTFLPSKEEKHIPYSNRLPSLEEDLSLGIGLTLPPGMEDTQEKFASNNSSRITSSRINLPENGAPANKQALPSLLDDIAGFGGSMFPPKSNPASNISRGPWPVDTGPSYASASRMTGWNDSGNASCFSAPNRTLPYPTPARMPAKMPPNYDRRVTPVIGGGDFRNDRRYDFGGNDKYSTGNSFNDNYDTRDPRQFGSNSRDDRRDRGNFSLFYGEHRSGEPQNSLHHRRRPEPRMGNEPSRFNKLDSNSVFPPPNQSNIIRTSNVNRASSPSASLDTSPRGNSAFPPPSLPSSSGYSTAYPLNNMPSYQHTGRPGFSPKGNAGSHRTGPGNELPNEPLEQKSWPGYLPFRPGFQ